MEGELAGVNGSRCVHRETKVRLAFLEDVKVTLVVIGVILYPDGKRLAATGGEGNLQLGILKDYGLCLSGCRRVKKRIRILGCRSASLRSRDFCQGCLRMLCPI